VSWEAVARKDYRDAVRARWLWALTAIIVAILSLVSYMVWPAPGETVSSSRVINSFLLPTLITTILPLAALIVSYDAITGEQSSGSLKLLLSLPHSRTAVVAGKLAGRSAAVATPVVLGFLLPAILLAIGPVSFNVLGYVAFIALTALLGAAFVGIALGLSAATASERLALAGSVGAFFLFVPLWKAIQFPLQLYLMSQGNSLPVNPQELFRYLDLLNPTGAYKHLLGTIASAQSQDVLLALVVLYAWVFVPPALGALVFQRRDL